MKKRKIFIICPVRPPQIKLLKKIYQKTLNLAFGIIDTRTKNQNTIKEYVTKLEAEDWEVYWPFRDNPHQKTDRIGFTICKYNCQKLLYADEVHIWYDKNSTGSVFDIGMFFIFVKALGFKKFVIINRGDILPTADKSFENVILALAKEFDSPTANGLKERWTKNDK